MKLSSNIEHLENFTKEEAAHDFGFVLNVKKNGASLFGGAAEQDTEEYFDTIAKHEFNEETFKNRLYYLVCECCEEDCRELPLTMSMSLLKGDKRLNVSMMMNAQSLKSIGEGSLKSASDNIANNFFAYIIERALCNN